MGKGWGEGEANGVGALVAALVYSALVAYSVYGVLGYSGCSGCSGYVVYIVYIVYLASIVYITYITFTFTFLHTILLIEHFLLTHKIFNYRRL